MEYTTRNGKLHNFVEETIKLCTPNKVVWYFGTDEEYKALCDELVTIGTFIPLNPIRPNSFLARSHPADTTLQEDKTFVCTSPSGRWNVAGTTSKWAERSEMEQKLNTLFKGAMAGRTMYIIPFALGPPGSEITKYGVEITDHPLVAVTMTLMARVGKEALDAIEAGAWFLPCLHSVGRPLEPGQKDVPWPCNPENHILAYMPESPSRLYSYGMLYEGSSVLAQKWFCLHAISRIAKEDGWLSEHAAVISVTSPKGKKYYIAAIFPRGAGKTTFALQIPKLAGWSVRCVSPDTAWLFIGPDGVLRAVNPQAGFFGVLNGFNDENLLSLSVSIERDTIFFNAALTPDGDVWWEGKTSTPPEGLIDWQGKPWTPNSNEPASHPNARFTFHARNCPVMDPNWNKPAGVPISAIIFGERRRDTIPLLMQARNWQQGVFYAATMCTEVNPKSGHKLQLQRDPFGILPFASYPMTEYFAYWLEIGSRISPTHLPAMFILNLFREGEIRENGSMVNACWPGFGDNSRLLKWICRRIDKDPTLSVLDAAPGLVPLPDDIDTTGMRINRNLLAKLLFIDRSEWLRECEEVRTYFTSLGAGIPSPLVKQLNIIEHRLHREDDKPPTRNKKLLAWVEEMVKLCKPDNVHWCTGSKEEYRYLANLLCEKGTFVRLNGSLRPNSFLARSHPDDTARVEDRTFICTPTKEEAGPTNNWCDPKEMHEKLDKLFDGCMQGRTMYVIPFCMGPLHSTFARYGVQITDSAYVVVNMHIMATVGLGPLEAIGDEGDFLPCLHSVGAPLQPGEKDVSWPCNPTKYICHFPHEPSIISFGSGYGGNALLGKKCFALRIASYWGWKEGWMAEHCLILNFISPQGKSYYILGAFPSACGKTNLAMLVPTIPGWTVKCVGDDIAWLRIGSDGRLYAVNPEMGYFGVAPGTSEFTNQSAMQTLSKNSIFTNVALTPEGDVWWEGKTETPPPLLEDWTHQLWTPGCGRKAAHPNARYTTPAKQNPVLDPNWQHPDGVPVSAILFGGRRSKMIPLVCEAFDWEHGVFMGSTCSSETTAAAKGAVGVVRRDPFSMLPFIGYNAGDYFKHWLEMGKKLGDKAPKIFFVNWFRKDENGNWMWPGFGENSRVLKWVCERVDGVGKAKKTPIGYLPTEDALDLRGLKIDKQNIQRLISVDRDEWIQEAKDVREYYKQFGDRLPEELIKQLEALEHRLTSNNP